MPYCMTILTCQNEFSKIGPVKLVFSDKALMEGEIPSGVDPVARYFFHIQSELDGDDERLENHRCGRTSPGTFNRRNSPTRTGIRGRILTPKSVNCWDVFSFCSSGLRNTF